MQNFRHLTRKDNISPIKKQTLRNGISCENIGSEARCNGDTPKKIANFFAHIEKISTFALPFSQNDTPEAQVVELVDTLL